MPGTGPRADNLTRKLSVAERRARAMELRLAGRTYEQIANELGYQSKGGAYNAVKRALKDTLQEPAEALRTAELERLDRILAKLWAVVEDMDTAAPTTTQLRTIDRILRIMERRAQYLGLDDPVKY